MDTTGTRAVIYLDESADVDRARAACLAHCDERGYEVAALVIGAPDGQAWRDGVRTMLDAGEVEVVVLHSRADLPPNRTPRVEFAGDRVVHERRRPWRRRRPA